MKEDVTQAINTLRGRLVIIDEELWSLSIAVTSLKKNLDGLDQKKQSVRALQSEHAYEEARLEMLRERKRQFLAAIETLEKHHGNNR